MAKELAEKLNAKHINRPYKYLYCKLYYQILLVIL